MTAQAPVEKTVILEYPLTRGDKQISQLVIRKPKTGALRGVKLADLLQLDVDALCKVVPRICPDINDNEMRELDPADFTEVATAVIGFFVKSEKESPTT